MNQSVSSRKPSGLSRRVKVSILPASERLIPRECYQCRWNEPVGGQQKISRDCRAGEHVTCERASNPYGVLAV